MNTIRLDFCPLPHPYPGEPESAFEKWGKIILDITAENGQSILSLVEIEWDISVLIQWFSENKEALLNEDFPMKAGLKTSIAESLAAFYTSGSFDDEVVDMIYEYRTRHGLVFALRGTNILDTYIGKYNGVHTASCCLEAAKFTYSIDLRDFFFRLEKLRAELNLDN
jgi:hypothetical protein